MMLSFRDGKSISEITGGICVPSQEFSSLPKKKVSYFYFSSALATPRACDHVTSKLPGKKLGQ